MHFFFSGTPPPDHGGGGPDLTILWYWPNGAGLLLISSGQVPEMAAHPYSGSFSTSDATNGQSPVPPLPHIASCPTGPLIAPPKLWQIYGI
jgi:hypothetical protein